MENYADGEDVGKNGHGGRGWGGELLAICSPHVLRQDGKILERQRSWKRVTNIMIF
jgi:hypothetical protein